MAGKSRRNKAKEIILKLGAVLLALGCLFICGSLFLMFWRSEVFPQEVRILFLICDGLMCLAILWLLRHYLVYFDREG